MKLSINIFIIMILFLTHSLHARGVDAGTIISNTAHIYYSNAGVDHNFSSNTVIDVVEQLIDPLVDFTQNSPTYIESGDTLQALTFRLTNIGNGADKFRLFTTPASSAVTTSSPTIYIDSDADGVFNPSQDIAILDINLSADESVVLFVVNSIVNSELTRASRHYFTLQAVSVRGGSGVAGRVHPSAGVDSTSAIDGLRGGVSSDVGVYEVLAFKVKIDKSVADVVNTQGEPNATTGATITYALEVYLDGDGSASNIVLVDNIPQGMEYVDGSMQLNGVALSDAVDGDEGDFNTTAIRVRLGEISDESAKQRITFKAVIQ